MSYVSEGTLPWLLASSIVHGTHPCDYGIFGMFNIATIAIANRIIVLLDSFGLFNKVIVYFKNERSNSNTLVIALTNLVSCFTI
jgi:hypothetical protein